MNSFTKRPQPTEIMLVEASSPFLYMWLDNDNINQYAKFDSNIPCGLRVISIFNTTGPTDAQQNLVNPKRLFYFACQWLDNVDMHMYANFDPNISCGSRVMSFFTNC